MNNITRVKKGESLLSGKVLVTCTVTIFGLGAHSGTGEEWADDDNGMTSADASIWAVAYRLLGALPDTKSAMLYSLNAITSYGHTSPNLEVHWHLMGALEALNGWLLFGLTTAFLFGVLEKVRLLDSEGPL